ncbi:hypothetical protein BDN71DRAFT_457379 [Pleurotus eryngii]|uniref:DUF6534 domain-containing protein n=1 Tax=Pleurotus eryngii TaxID=5323 RepID=A0A9P5ZIM0_PLEER|nr:hypothetical protein BDN71DRAFT_457379 [Pleurotus eryngii]
MSGLPDRVTPMSQSTFEEIFGSSLVACQVMFVLYGIASLQAYMYYVNYPRDSLRMKALVGGIWGLATLHAALLTHTVYHYSVKSYTRPMILPDGEWSCYTAVATGIIICFIVQTYFTRMIFLMMSGRWRVILTAALILLLVAQIGFGIYFSYSLFHLWELLKLHECVYTAMVPLFVTRVISDATVSATLCIILYDARGFNGSMRMIKTLIIYSINRFLLTTLLVVTQTVILISRPESIWAMVIEYITAQLYVNSFLATLNSRNRLRHIGGQDSSVHISSASRPRVTAVSAPRFRGESWVESQRGDDVKFSVENVGGIKIGTETLALSDFGVGQKTAVRHQYAP